jgi:hypothetical protein
MTREEAIKELEEDKALYMPEEWIESLDRDTPDGRLITALDMAIKALEQDCISRTDMLDAIGHGTTYTSEDLQRIVKDLPSANREYGVKMSGIPTGSEIEETDDMDAMLEHLWNATEEDHRKYSEIEASSSNFIQLKQDVLNNKQLWRKLREIEDEDTESEE